MTDLPAYLVLGTLFVAVVVLLRQNSNLAGKAREYSEQRVELERCASIDPLTGLHNRLVLSQIGGKGTPDCGVVAVLDLDNLKQINDQLGHEAGDEVLRSAADFIRASIRKHDLACRWGGDEFVVFFRNQESDSAEQRLRHIEQRLWQFRLRCFGRLPLRVSWGTAPVDSGALQEAIRVADARMYEMKRRRKSTDSRTSDGAVKYRTATA